MRKIILLTIFLSIHLCLLQAQTYRSERVKTKIKSLVIYLDGAEITRNKIVKLDKGRNTITFTELSPILDPKSIRVALLNSNETNSILAISNKINYITKIDEKPRIKTIKDSLERIEINIQSLADEFEAYQMEKELLVVNKSIGGADKGVSITELEQASNFYRKRIMEINSNISKIALQSKKNKKIQTRLKSELKELNSTLNYRRSEITILLSAEISNSATIEVKYLVSKAGWSPSYDIKAKDINKPVELIYRAKVYNNTNIDWTDVKFKLSTADPTQSASQPILKPWYLNYKSEYISNNDNRKDFQNNLGYAQNMLQWQVVQSESTIVTGNIETTDYTEIEISDLNAEFDIKTTYTIPSDDRPYLVDVTEHELPATYKHYAIPKLDRDAFLLARVTGWEDLNLVEGPANIYFGETYIGRSYIYTRNVRDTLDLSLGRDKKILVTRSKLKDFSSTKFIGTKRKDTYAYEMIIKNNRKAPINIELRDQLPVSQDSEIEVDSEEVSNANVDELTGVLKWKFNIAPGQTEKVNLKFWIKSPKNKPIVTKQSQKRKMRNF